MIKCDITSAYHRIEMFAPHPELLGFSWVGDNGQVIFISFLFYRLGYRVLHFYQSNFYCKMEK
jgi:hypothetical protein